MRSSPRSKPTTDHVRCEPFPTVFDSLLMTHFEHRRGGRAGFTLVELLAVIAIIAILAAISLNIASGARTGAMRDTAKAELAVLQGALEDYKRVYKSYPQTSTAVELLVALSGRAGPTGTATNRAPFVSLAGLNLRDEDPAEAGNVLVDPWGQAYVYQPMVQQGRWQYFLYSIGPDGADSPISTDGELDLKAESNLDNIYAHR